GKRYATVTRETKNLARGLYGETAAPIDGGVLTTILGEDKPITHRPADDLPAELEKAKADIGDLAESVEDVLSYVMFPQPAKEFLQWRREGGGPERELVAAVIGAMVIGEKRAAAPSPAAAGESHNGSSADPWKSFGRLRQMR
ncbi:MAG: hypothetical protein WED87_04855, partial [Dehalococcoidia bacterium]